MKVAIIIPTLGMGGAERVAVSLSNWLAKNNVDTYFINMSKKTDNYKIDEKVKAFHRQHTPENQRILKRIYFEKKYVLETLNQVKPDVIFEMLYYPLPFLFLYKHKNKNVVIIGSERSNPKKGNKKIIYKILAKIAPKYCDGYIFQTEKVRKMFPKKIRNKSIVIPNAVSNPDVYETENPTIKNKTITNVGRLEPQKGQDTLIKAFKIVNEKFPEYKLIIYGEGTQRKSLEELIRILELKNKVFLEGKKTNVVSNIIESEMFVFTSRYEGMPNALLEAMACGLPCISTDCVAGPSEIITNNKNGILVEVDNIEKIAEKIIYLIENKDEAKKIGMEAKKVLQTHSTDNIFNSYYNYFNYIYEKRKKF